MHGPPDAYRVPRTPPALEWLARSLASAAAVEQSIVILYHKPGAALEARTIDPLRVDGNGTAVWVLAHCHDRDAPRSFLLDRIVHAEPLEPKEGSGFPSPLLRSSGPQDRSATLHGLAGLAEQVAVIAHAATRGGGGRAVQLARALAEELYSESDDGAPPAGELLTPSRVVL